jgi:MFS transporter, DHA2 family, multidrug resistance protein
MVTSLALALGTFMQVLDSTIANVSLPTICGNLGVSTDNGTWVITAFAVANGVMVPLTGWLMGRFGIVRVFVSAIVAFTFASLLCGLAWNLPSLISFRILQGAVSGPLIPGSQALLIAIFPSNRRSTALSIWSMTTMSAPVFGPVLGGYISDNFYWGWIFLINVPIGLVAATVTRYNLHSRQTPTHKLPIDKVGLALLTFWVFSLQTMLDLGKNADWFNSSAIVILAIFSVVGFVTWIIWELTEGRPAVDLTLFRNRNFSIGVIALCSGYALMFSNNVLLPLWLQTQMNYTATWAGLVSAPAGLVAVAVSPFVGRIKWDPRFTATLAFAAYGVGFIMRAHYTPDASFLTLTLPLFIQGIAMATFFVPLLNVMLDGIPPEKVPSATGISNFARITSGSFAASIITTFWDRRETLHQSQLVESMTATAPIYAQNIDQLQNLNFSELQASAAVMRELITQSYLLSAIELFQFCGFAAFSMIVVVWFARRPQTNSRGPARR